MGNEPVIGQGRTAEIMQLPGGKDTEAIQRGFPRGCHLSRVSDELVYSVGIKTAPPYEVISRGKRLGIVYDYVHGKTRLREKRYIELSGISLSEIERWTMPVAAARLVEWVPEEEKNQLVQCVRERLSDMIDT